MRQILIIHLTHHSEIAEMSSNNWPVLYIQYIGELCLNPETMVFITILYCLQRSKNSEEPVRTIRLVCGWTGNYQGQLGLRAFSCNLHLASSGQAPDIFSTIHSIWAPYIMEGVWLQGKERVQSIKYETNIALSLSENICLLLALYKYYQFDSTELVKVY